MTPSLRIVLFIGVVIYLIVIVSLLTHKKLSLKYSLIWMFSAVVLLLISFFPGIASFIASLLGIKSTVNAVFLIIFFCMLLVMISLSSIVSKQSQQIKKLIQHVAILENRIDKK